MSPRLRGNYERVLRTAVFTIVRKYPSEAFETFFYCKPSMIIQTMTDWNWLWWAAAPTEIIWLALLQGALLAGFVLVQPPRAPIGDAMNRAGVLLLFVIPALLPPLVAWGGAGQVDLTLYMMCACAIVLWVVVSAASHVSRNVKSNPGAEKNDPNVDPGSPAPVDQAGGRPADVGHLSRLQRLARRVLSRRSRPLFASFIRYRSARPSAAGPNGPALPETPQTPRNLHHC